MKRIPVVPTIITLGNAVCGFAAITFAAKIGFTKSGGTPHSLTPTEFQYLAIAGWMIMLAMVFDALDGRVARMTNMPSDFGAELDSLCDMVSFGVAPAFLMTRMCPDFFPRALWTISALYTMCAALRLARFNVETEHDEEAHMFFKGLPSPAAAGAIASVAVFYSEFGEVTEWIRLLVTKGLPFGTLMVAILMASRIRYSHILNQLVARQQTFGYVVKFLLIAVVIVMVQELALPLMFWTFAVSGLLRWAYEFVFLRRRKEEPIF